MAIGRPIELTPNITSKNISVASTEGQTEFTVTGGYRINELSVYRNGVRLVDGRDFSATDGTTVTLISDTVEADDIIEFSVLDSFDVAGVIVGAASSQTLSGNLHITGDLFTGTFNPNNVVSGAGTFSGAVNVDATTDSTSVTTGALIVDGGLGVAKNVYIGAGLSVAGTLTYEDVTSVDSVGLITAKSGVNITGGQLQVGAAFSVGPAGVVTAASYYGDGSNLSNITSTTINSNADNRLITGSGTANTLNGESNLTFDGSTLTVTGAQTVTGDLFFDNGSTAGKDILWDVSEDALIFNDSTYLKMGSDGDCSFEHTGNAFLITNTTGSFFIRPKLSENGITLVPDGEVNIYYDNSLKLATTNDGTVTTGIATATGGHITGGGEFKVGTALTVASTSGVATFSNDVTFKDAGYQGIKFENSGVKFSDQDVFFVGDNQTIKWVHDGNCIRWEDSAEAQWGTGQDLRIAHNGTEGTFNITTGDLIFKYSNQETFRIGDTGVKITGIATVTEGLNTDGLLSEKFETTAGKLSDNTNIDLADGMVHYFTTQESTTATPNIRYSSSKSLNNMLSTGDAITVTIITTAAAAGYSANWTIDGSAVTEEWIGGEAPTEGSSDGYDIYTANILKTADATFKVFINLVNAT